MTGASVRERPWRLCPWCGQLVALHDGDPTMTCGRVVDAIVGGKRIAKATKRGYSRDFTPPTEAHGRYLLDKIPAQFWVSVKAKAKREGISIRALILGLLKEWLERR